jgi:hypothetical protein
VQDLHSLALGDIDDGGPKRWTAFAIAREFLHRLFMKLIHKRPWSNWSGGCVVLFLREKPMFLTNLLLRACLESVSEDTSVVGSN